MGKFSDWRKARADKETVYVERRGFFKWFQVMVERFSPMFWSGLLAMLCMTPACLCLVVHGISRDWLSLLGALLCFALGAPGLVSLFFICMQAIRGNPTWVWDSFRKAWFRDSRKAIPVALLIGLLWLGFLTAVRLVISGTVTSIPLLAMLLMAGVLLSGFSFFSFQQLATVELPLGDVLRNGLLLTFAGKGRSLTVSILTLSGVLAGAWFSYVSYFVLMIGVLAVLVMTGELIFYPVFEMLFLDEEEE